MRILHLGGQQAPRPGWMWVGQALAHGVGHGKESLHQRDCRAEFAPRVLRRLGTDRDGAHPLRDVSNGGEGGKLMGLGTTPQGGYPNTASYLIWEHIKHP